MNWNPELRAVTLAALTAYRGDDAARARREFRGLTPEQMQEQHGQSGKTRAEVLATYEQREAKVNAAIVFITRAL